MLLFSCPLVRQSSLTRILSHIAGELQLNSSVRSLMFISFRNDSEADSFLMSCALSFASGSASLMTEQIALFRPFTVSSLSSLVWRKRLLLQSLLGPIYSFRVATGHILLIFPSLSFKIEISLGFKLLFCPFFVIKLLWGLSTRDCVVVNLLCSWSLTRSCNLLIFQHVANSSRKAAFLSKLYPIDTSNVCRDQAKGCNPHFP